MKNTDTVESSYCDACNKHSWYSCLNCGMDLCYDCRKTVGVVYPYAVYFSGSYDGTYCKPCDAKLRVSKDNQLHLAYLRIQDLKQEQRAFYDSFDARSKETESLIEKLRQ